MKQIIFVIIYLCLSWNISFAQVQVIRNIPQQAQQVILQEVSKEKLQQLPIKLSGRLNLGSQITKDTQGRQATTLNSLSSLAFSTVFGLTGDIALNNQKLINGDTQNMSLGLSMQKGNCPISFKTTNSEKNTIVGDKLKTDKGEGVSFSLGLGLIKNLPINISYSNNNNRSNDAGTITQKTATENISFGLRGKALNRINWNATLNRANTKDILNDKKTKNSGLSCGFDMPINDKVSMNTAISSSLTNNYLSAGNSTKITQQACQTNLNFKVSDKLNTAAGVSYNTNESKTNSGTKNTSSSLGNNLNLSYQLLKTTNISWTLNQTNSKGVQASNSNINLTHTYIPQQSKTSNVNLSYGLSQSKANSGKTDHHNLNLTSAAKLTNSLFLTQGIGISKESDKLSWQTNTGVRYNVAKISAGIDLGQNKAEEGGKLTSQTQNIQTNLSYPLKALNRDMPVNLNYGYNLAGIEKVKSTSGGFSFSLPITNYLGFGYAYSQSRSPQSDSYNHTFNTSLRGKTKPYSLNTTVGFLKADKLTQDLSVNLNYPLGNRLSLTATSHYTKKEDTKPAYNFTTGIGYSF
ncbi:MAG: hypothetical protein V1749_04650 [Candidatus Desantisbacteria bacterium]